MDLSQAIVPSVHKETFLFVEWELPDQPASIEAKGLFSTG